MSSLILLSRRHRAEKKIQVVASVATSPVTQPGNCPGAQCVSSTLADVKRVGKRILDRIDDMSATSSRAVVSK